MSRSISLIFFTAALIFAGQASAALVGSKHDLSSLGGEPCAYCHSAHHTVGGLGRPAYMGDLPDITKVYNSVTFDHDPVTTTTTVNNSDAPLCLSCHDGATAGDDVNMVDLKTTYIIGTDLDIGDSAGDLSNDHPVGFAFNPLLDTQEGIKPPPEGSSVHVTFGPNNDEMWCSSCHHVHSNTYPPFLATSNSGSRLCLVCHDK